MQPLTLDDILPLDEFANRRREFFDSLERYVDRYRRVRIGPELTLLFQNRQTLWFRLQEVLRIARLQEPNRVQKELDLYNRLLPGRNRLQAALMIEVSADKPVSVALARWKNLKGDALRLHVGTKQIPAKLITCRPEDRCIGTVHWVQLHLEMGARLLVADFELRARFVTTLPSYRHESHPLSQDVRQSLLEDLELSDRDE